jgi:exopolysaccharide biosynthesis polyprenyl glycosylphosphotransferase
MVENSEVETDCSETAEPEEKTAAPVGSKKTPEQVADADDLSFLDNTKTIQMQRFPQFDKYLHKPFYSFCKRAFDIFASALGLIILSPLLLITALIIKCQDGGPVFFKQKRVGLNGKKFKMIKFRSMVPDAEAKLKEVYKNNEESGPLFKMKDDPRITKFGKFIRKTSIDELPQLFNVLGGSMSLVGPRPALPHEVNQYDALDTIRLLVKPGITCIWQVSGRSKLGFKEQMELDREYITKRSLHYDFYLLLKTIPAVLSHKGAE